MKLTYMNFERCSVFLCAAVLMLSVPCQLNAQKKKKDEVKEDTTKAWQYEKSMAGMFEFRSIGPAVYSGRISDIAVNPNDHSEYYVGVASGGLWKTENHGTTFTPIFDSQDVFSIGCLALDPNNANVIWVGTGENNSQRNLAYGDGVYKSTDGGKSFSNMGLKTSRQIGKIMVDPRNSNIVYVAAQGQAWGPGGERGLYKTTDGGQTWDRILYVSEHTGVSDMEMDPRNPDILYAAAHQRERRVFSKINGGPESAIYKSVDAGKNWTKLKKGLPGGDVGRIGLALSPANPNLLYAVIELPESKSGFYRSSDMGESWEKRSDKGTSSPQYYNELYADPLDQDVVIMMDTRNALSDDGGKTWQNIEGRNKHVDNHAMWIDPADTRHYLMGCDGGLYETYDRGETWQFKSNLPITQYYHVRTDNDYPFYNVYGGTQDNGSWMGPSRTHRRYIVNSDWTHTLGGDGYLSIPDPDNPDIHYCESQYCGLSRYDRTTGNTVSIQPQPTEDEEFRWNWNTPYFISPFDSKTLYVAGNYVFKTTDMGNSWKKISPDLTRQIDQNSLPMMGRMWPPEAVAKNLSTSKFGNIFALAESPLRQGMIYAGTDDGLIWITENDGKDWTRYDSFAGVPDTTFVNYILPSMHDTNTVYSCFDGRKNNSDFKPYILKSTDKGKTWSSIAANLPSGTVYAIQEDHINPDILFIGTEWGVWSTIDGGQHWVQLKKGLPTIQVKDLTIQRREDDLVVASFGRGFYVLEDYSPLRELSESLSEKQAHIFDIEDAYLYYPSRNLSYQGDVYYRSKNPDPAAVFRYYVKEGFETLKQKRVKAQKKALEEGTSYPYPGEEELIAEEQEKSPSLVFTIYDASDRIMRKIAEPYRKGYNEVTWDLAYLQRRGAEVPPGEYKVALDKLHNAEVTRLVEPRSFKVFTLDNALGSPDYNANFAFMTEVGELWKQVSAAREKLGDMDKRLETLRDKIKELPIETGFLLEQIENTQRDIDNVKKVISGGPGSKNTVSSRLGFATWASSSAQVDIMGSQREQFELAQEDYTAQEELLLDLYELRVPELERQFQEAGGILYNLSPR